MVKSPANLRSGWTAVAVLAALAPAWATAQPKSDPKRSQLPAAVVKAINANCPGAEIDKLDVAEDGTVLDVATIVQLKDVPEAVAAVIRKAAGSGGIRQVEKSEVRAKIETKDGKGRLVPVAPPEYVYEAELAKGGEIEVRADGQVIKGPESDNKESPGEK
jgi:hypothetical protein